LILLLFVLCIAAPAVASAQCAAEQTAAECCRQISQAAVELKYEPGCLSPQHRTPVTFTPCAELCVSAPCHKPLVTRYPCGSVCIEDACHMPAVIAEPCGACGAAIELTGCRCQIEHRDCGDGCECVECACDGCG
jgi:hypothetical protein